MSESLNSYPCPVCGYLTLGEKPPGTFDICQVCFWEDDDLQYHNPDYQGGANDESLNEAKSNFAGIGAISARWLDRVRPPHPNEIPGDRD